MTHALTNPAEMNQFRTALLQWFSTQQRDLPWRRTREPYAIWVSEIMLQQTRVAAVIPYYERFMAQFPNIPTLANASEDELLAQWAGLGYYYRARNLQIAARAVTRLGGFPREYAAIRELPGIGDYTAAAIASISFDLPHAVLDGNVFRVLSRLFGDGTNIASTTGKRHFASLADALLDKSQPGTFNQAVMELGATVCLPKAPQCLVCPLAPACLARTSGSQSDFPVKTVARKSVQERRMLFWIEHAGAVLAWQRGASARLMPGFWELPERQQLPAVTPLNKLGEFRHGITFHSYTFELWTATVPADIGMCEPLRLSSLRQIPISTVFKKAARLVPANTQESATVRPAVSSTR